MQWAVQESQRFSSTDQFCLGSPGLDWRRTRWMTRFQFLAIFFFAVRFQFSAIKYLASLNHFLDCVSTECIPQRHIRSKDEVDFVTFDQSQSQRCPVHTRPPHKRICSFLQRKNPNCFPYTYLTEEHPTEQSDQFSIYLCINIYILCFMGHPLITVATVWGGP